MQFRALAASRRRAEGRPSAGARRSPGAI